MKRLKKAFTVKCLLCILVILKIKSLKHRLKARENLSRTFYSQVLSKNNCFKLVFWSEEPTELCNIMKQRLDKETVLCWLVCDAWSIMLCVTSQSFWSHECKTSHVPLPLMKPSLLMKRKTLGSNCCSKNNVNSPELCHRTVRQCDFPAVSVCGKLTIVWHCYLGVWYTC